MQLSPDELFVTLVEKCTVRFVFGFTAKNRKGRLPSHWLRHHGPERRFVCSGTKQKPAIMSIHQCDLFRGRREADYLMRSAELIRFSVGPLLSCTRRLMVDDEFRLVVGVRSVFLQQSGEVWSITCPSCR